MLWIDQYRFGVEAMHILEVEDKFDRADSATLGGGWESSDGNWTINTNRATQTTGATDVVRHLTAMSDTDMWVRATRESPTDGALSVCLRMNSAKTQFYMATYNTASTEWQIHRFDGSFTLLASVSDSGLSALVYFRFEAIGDDLRLLVADPEGTLPILMLTATDSTFAHSFVGIRGNSTGSTVNHVDDFGAGTFG